MCGYDQRSWAHPCGTPSCIAGWAVAWHYAEGQGAEGIGMLDLHEVYGRETGERVRSAGGEPAGIEAEGRINEFRGWLMRRGRKVLGLDLGEAATLFDQDPRPIAGGGWKDGGPTVEDAVATLRESAARGRIAWTRGGRGGQAS